MFELTERRRLSDLIAHRIREYILENKLGPGDRLPTEIELARQFGVSRVSIREATKALGFLGILEAMPRRGTTVGQVNLGRITQFLELHPSMRDASPEQLIDSRLIVELGVLPALIERMQNDPTVYDRLNNHLKSFEAIESLSEWLETDRDFHCLMLDESQLTPLFLFREVLAVFFNRIEEGIQNPASLAELQAELPAKAQSHQRIIDLLREGKLAEAEMELKDHISSYRHRLVLNGCPRTT